MAIKRAMDAGIFRFPRGYGSLKLVRIRPLNREQQMPGGQVLPARPLARPRLRYRQGTTVQRALGVFNYKYVRRTPAKDALTEEVSKRAEGK